LTYSVIHLAHSALFFLPRINMSKIILPAIGTPMPHLGGTFWAIQRALPRSGQADYALIVPHGPVAEAKDIDWGGYGNDEPAAACMYDGQANTRALVASAVNHPAAQLCAGLVIDGFNDFYLPAARELKALFANGCDAFNSDKWYWSSTQFSRNYAYGQDFNYGGTRYGTKAWQGGLARAVRRSSIESLIN